MISNFVYFWFCLTWMQSVGHECRSQLAVSGAASFGGMDDFTAWKDSRWGTEYTAAANLANKAPAKFRAIVYHGIFLLTKWRH
jgi:hypothetical protein